MSFTHQLIAILVRSNGGNEKEGLGDVAGGGADNTVGTWDEGCVT
jgi:hypothetical protein